jgi:hypothetical protein
VVSNPIAIEKSAAARLERIDSAVVVTCQPAASESSELCSSPWGLPSWQIRCVREGKRIMSESQFGSSG